MIKSRAYRRRKRERVYQLCPWTVSQHRGKLFDYRKKKPYDSRGWLEGPNPTEMGAHGGADPGLSPSPQ